MSVHIGSQPGQVAESILLPGDPLRAKYIAEKFFDDVICFNEVRGMLGFTGTYKGKKVSSMGTGMGIPSISIYVNELIKYNGVENLIRVGTCGSFRDDLGLKSIILAQGACTNSDFNRLVFPGTYAPAADFEFLRTAYLTAKEKDIEVHVGNVLSSDTFYSEPDPKFKHWAEYGVLGVEMEAAGLYTIAARERKKALCILSVSDGAGSKEILTPEERERSLDAMLELALDTAIKM